MIVKRCVITVSVVPVGSSGLRRRTDRRREVAVLTPFKDDVPTRPSGWRDSTCGTPEERETKNSLRRRRGEIVLAPGRDVVARWLLPASGGTTTLCRNRNPGSISVSINRAPELTTPPTKKRHAVRDQSNNHRGSHRR